MAEGCYVPRYLPASFKGVPFQALDVESEHGRRGAEGEFPFGEQTGYQDMGRRIRKFPIEGRFITNNHIAEAAALIAVVESPGPGLLVHPTRGVLLVGCSRLRVKDNPVEEQGVTTFSAEFVEANDWIGGGAFGSVKLFLDIAGLVLALGGFFARNYRPDNVAFFSRDAAIAPATAGLRSIADEVRRAVAGSTTDHDNAWWVVADLEAIAGDPRAMGLGPTVLESMNLGLVALASFLDASAKFGAMKRIANGSARRITLPADGGRTQSAAMTAIRSLAATHMAQSVLEEVPSTLAEALRKADQVSRIYEDEMEAARAWCDNELFLKLRDMRVAALKGIMSNAYELPPVVEYDFGHSVHSLRAAYEILGDAKRFREIEARNPGSAPWAMGRRVVSGVR